jgi:hypothetical protein
VAIDGRPIFVVELPGAPSFAFEAADETQAAAFARAPWFKAALERYFRSKQIEIPEQTPSVQLRPATREEITAYRDLAHEFADMTDCFLFAPVP